MKSKFKKFVSMLLALIMALSVMLAVPITAGAAEKEEVSSGEGGYDFVSGDFGCVLGDNNTVMISAYLGDDTSEIIFPAEISGGTVTAINGMLLFRESQSLKRVTIPDTVAFIGPYAFGYYLDEEVWKPKK